MGEGPVKQALLSFQRIWNNRGCPRASRLQGHARGDDQPGQWMFFSPGGKENYFIVVA
jgi:hypothetical protein